MEKIIPEIGKWYVSKGMKAGRADAKGIDMDISKHNRSRTESILGGPFDSKEKAKQAITQNPEWYEPYCWQKD